jgi:aspartyl-tRNA(Asn)/glutamyl-tRNA(Gln) amidotransferase subunit C
LENIDKNLIGKLSGLVKLNLNDQEIKKLSVDLTDILSSFSKLNSINLDNFNEFDDSLKENNQTREDQSEPSWDKENILKNAPNHNGDELFIELVLGEE